MDGGALEITIAEFIVKNDLVGSLAVEACEHADKLIG